MSVARSAATAAYMLLLCANSLAAQNSTLSLRDYAAQKMDEHQVVGAAIAIIENGEIAKQINLGFESNESKVPIHHKSVFQVGSISKPVAAWAAMTLVRDGKLSLDEPIHKYLKRWQIPESKFNAEHITLRQLLSHTAGFGLRAYGGFETGQTLPSLEESLAGKTNGSGSLTLIQKPGKGYLYSGGGYTLIQLLVEELSGQTFSDYAQLSVLEPLKMDDSSYEPSTQLLKRRIQPHGFSHTPIVQHEFRAQAAASLHTTVTDLSRFVLANLKNNSVHDRRIVSQMHSPAADVGFAGIGLGFFISGDNHTLVGHGGSNFGWRSEVQFRPSTKDGLIVMTNSESASQFLNEVKCYWDSQLKLPALDAWCDNYSSHLIESNALAKTIVQVLSLSIALIVILSAWALLTSRCRIILPQSRVKLITLITLIGITLFIVIFVYTPLGVYLVSGFKSIFATVHYAPKPVAIIVPWLCSALFIICLAMLLVRNKH